MSEGVNACARVIRITVWVVSKNESNCLLENKRSGEISDYCTLFSQTFYGLLAITDVTSYVHHKFPVSFLLYIATEKI